MIELIPFVIAGATIAICHFLARIAYNLGEIAYELRKANRK